VQTDLLDSTKDEDMAKWAGKLEDDIKGFHLEVNFEPCHDTDTHSVTHSVDV
jgi:hypothetical protein